MWFVWYVIGYDVVDLVGVDGFVFYQCVGYYFQFVVVFVEQLFGGIVVVVDDVLDFLVDYFGGFV